MRLRLATIVFVAMTAVGPSMSRPLAFAQQAVEQRTTFVPVPTKSQAKLGEVLPIPRPTYQPTTEPDLRKVQPPPRFEVKPPKGAPNVVIILMDQACYADPTGMGGPINTPTFDQLARRGLTYTNFHVCPLCSPSRAALLTGRNQHQCSMAGVAGTASAYPGDTSIRPQTITSIGRILQSWGYCTSYWGKCNEVPEYAVNVSGPFDLWPTHTGFDKFYGYIAGEQSLFRPSLIDGTTNIGTPRDPELSLHYRSDGQGGRVAEGDTIAHARQALHDVFRVERQSSTAHTAGGLAQAGSLQGKVQSGLGQDARGNPRAANQDGYRSAGHEARGES